MWKANLMKSTRTYQLLSTISFLCASWFIITALLIHYSNPDYDVFSQTLSQYALGRHGKYLETGFFSIGISQTIAAYLVYSHGKQYRTVSILFLLSAAGVVLVGIFPAQSESAGLLNRLPHLLGATMQFMFFPGALLLLNKKGVITKPGSSNLQQYTFFTGILTAILFLVILVMFLFGSLIHLQIFGLVEKINIAFICVWLAISPWYLSPVADNPSPLSS